MDLDQNVGNGEIPSPNEWPEPDVKDTVTTVLGVILRTGTAYLFHAIMDALGF